MNFSPGVAPHILTLLLTVFHHTSLVWSDKTGVLMNSLFTFQDHACDKENLKIRCPIGTTIKIEWAQYGRQLPSHDMCLDLFRSASWPSLKPEVEDLNVEDTNCLATTSLDVVLQKCQDQRQCQVQAATSVFGQDPCPGTSKYLEVAYKCRPNEFRSRVTCQGETMQLLCSNSKRIAIYSAMYGRSQRGTLECPVTDAAEDTECESPCSMNVVLNECHRRRQCNIAVTKEMFGDSPCPVDVSSYLSVVFTCVSRRILRDMENDENYPTRFCGRETSSNKNDKDQINGNDGWLGEMTTIENTGTKTRPVDVPDNLPGLPPAHDLLTPSPNPDAANMSDISLGTNGKLGNDTADHVGVPVSEDASIGLITDWMKTWSYIEENMEKFILYLVIGVLVGIILLLLVIIYRLVITRRAAIKQAKLDITETLPRSPPPSQPEELTLLEHSSQSDGIEMVSYNRSSTLSRPSPYQSHSAASTTRTLNNYYG